MGSIFDDALDDNETQKKIITLMKANPNIAAGQIADEIGINKRNVKSNISKMKKDGLVEREGAKRNGRWIVNQ